MKQTLYILIIFFFVACSERRTENKETETIDTTLTIQTDTITTSTSSSTDQQIVTKEFLNLVEFIDSSGYISDTMRARKIFQNHNSTRIKTVNQYVFYDLRLEETVPIVEHKFHTTDRTQFEESRLDSTELKKWNEWRDRWELNFSLLQKVQKITSYFYVLKKPISHDGEKTFVDGIIEEWEFPDMKSVKGAAEDLAKKETMIYINRGAYICYFDNYMYVFHSRSAGFYTPLKKFLNYFANKNNATIPYKSEQRKSY